MHDFRKDKDLNSRLNSPDLYFDKEKKKWERWRKDIELLGRFSGLLLSMRIPRPQGLLTRSSVHIHDRMKWREIDLGETFLGYFYKPGKR